MTKNKIELNYIIEAKEIGVSINKKEYHIKMSENEVEIKNDIGKEIKQGSKLYDTIMLFCIQNSELN